MVCVIIETLTNKCAVVHRYCCDHMMPLDDVDSADHNKHLGMVSLSRCTRLLTQCSLLHPRHHQNDLKLQIITKESFSSIQFCLFAWLKSTCLWIIVAILIGRHLAWTEWIWWVWKWAWILIRIGTAWTNVHPTWIWWISWIDRRAHNVEWRTGPCQITGMIYKIGDHVFMVWVEAVTVYYRDDAIAKIVIRLA